MMTQGDMTKNLLVFVFIGHILVISAPASFFIKKKTFQNNISVN